MATTATTVTTVTTVSAIELRADGLGDFDFGTSPEDVIVAISSALGSPRSDLAVEFPVSVGVAFENAETLQTFASPSGRTVCWPGLCAQFGGDDLSTLSLVGWEVFADPDVATAPLATPDGVILGSRWSDFIDAMIVQPGGCPKSGRGSTTSGIDLALQGGQFSTTSESGEYVELLPDPGQVTVTGMRAGSQVVNVEEDC